MVEGTVEGEGTGLSHSINGRFLVRIKSVFPNGSIPVAGDYETAPDSRTSSSTFKEIPSRAFRAGLFRISFRFLTILPYCACVPYR